MSLFTERLDEWLGDSSALSDIRVVTRPCCFFDFDGVPVRTWQGQGRLVTSDDHEWLGSIDGKGEDHLQIPAISDSRDGSSPKYRFRLGWFDEDTYRKLRDEQWRVAGRTLTLYDALFQPGEGIRPGTPIEFFQDFIMLQTIFEEQVVMEGPIMVRRRAVTVVVKDDNLGASYAPNGKYTSTVQRERARQLGIENDMGCDFIAGLANRPYKRP